MRYQVAMRYQAARDVNMAVATWLLLSAFLWRHGGPQFLITALVGAVVVALAPFETERPRARVIDAVAGLGLVAAAIVLPRLSPVTAWHNIVVGLVIAVLSALSGPRLHHRPLFPRP